MRRREESGSALVELTWLGILLLVPVIWIVMSVFRVQSGAFAVTAATRAAARAFDLADTDGAGRARAQEAARLALHDQGLAGHGFSLLISCTPVAGDCHLRGSIIQVTIRSHVDLPGLPSVLGGGAPHFAMDATQVMHLGEFATNGHAG